MSNLQKTLEVCGAVLVIGLCAYGWVLFGAPVVR